MSTKIEYTNYITAETANGSNKAASYIRAIDLLGPILASQPGKHSNFSDLWSISSIAEIEALYKYVIEQQRLGDNGIFDSNYKPSYWESGFYSAALNSYKKFLILGQHEQRLWEIYNNQESPLELISTLLAAEEIQSVEALLSENDFDFQSREGRAAIRNVKTRIGQDFFRKMILSQYQTRCCITGLNVPEVLRASHIISWANDEENRLNPANGLCLSATYDAAFDKHLISFDEDYRMILSSSLKDYCTNEAFRLQFRNLEGSEISRPTRFLPDASLLEKHRNMMLA